MLLHPRHHLTTTPALLRVESKRGPFNWPRAIPYVGLSAVLSFAEMGMKVEGQTMENQMRGGGGRWGVGLGGVGWGTHMQAWKWHAGGSWRRAVTVNYGGQREHRHRGGERDRERERERGGAGEQCLKA